MEDDKHINWYVHKPKSQGSQIFIRTYPEDTKLVSPAEQLLNKIFCIGCSPYTVAKIPPQYTEHKSDAQRWADASLMEIAPKMYRQLRAVALWLGQISRDYPPVVKQNMLEVKAKIEKLLQQTTWRDLDERRQMKEASQNETK